MASGLSRLIAGPRRWWRLAEASLRSHPLLWSLLLAAGLTALAAGVLSPRFLGNDDFLIADMIDGSYSGEPQPHMVFTNVAIGLLLSSLYDAAGSVPWYGIYLYLVYFTGLAVIIYVALADDRPGFGGRALALAAYLAVFQMRMGTHIDFTSLALMLGGAGVVLYLCRAPLPRGHWASAVAAGMMLGAASLIRWHALYAVVLLTLPLLALTVHRIPWRRQALFTATTAAVVLAGSVFQAVYYAGKPGWQAYLDFNSTRGSVHQSPELAQIEPAVLAETGWSQNDLDMFQSWFYLDQDVYGIEQLRRITDMLGHPMHSLSSAVNPEQYRSPSWIMGFTLTASLFAAAWASGSRATRSFAILNVAWFGAVAAALLLFAKLDTRIAFPILAILALLLLTGPVGARPARPPDRQGSRLMGLLAAASCAILVIGVYSAVAGSTDRRADDDAVDQLLGGLTELDGDGIYVAGGFLGEFGKRSPWHAPMVPGPRLILLGWSQRSPVHDQWMAELGIDDLYLAIGSREDVYLPLPDLGFGRRYLTYLEEHYGFRGLLRPKWEYSGFTIFDLAVSYEIDGLTQAIIESHPDGTTVRYPLGGGSIVGRTRFEVVPDGILVRGRAADRREPGPVDHIVVFSGGQAVAVALPTVRPPTPREARWADRLGLPDAQHIGIAIKVPTTDDDVRVFALSNGRAAEITP